MTVDVHTGEIVEHLSPAEQERLTALETTVANGLATFVQVGIALAEIRAVRLYRSTSATFAGYARERFGIGRSHAYRMIDAARIADVVSPIGDIAGESQARELAGLSDDEALATYRVAQAASALKRGETSPTAQDVREARQALATPNMVEQAVERYPDLDAYRDRPEQLLNTAAALDGYADEDKAVRLDALAKHAAARREGRMPKVERPDTRAEEIFAHVNAAAQLLTGHEDAVVAAADSLIAETWRDQYRRTGQALLDLADRITHPSLRSVR